MTLFGLDLVTFALVVILMVACAGGIGRLLWLLDGSPPLDRPAFWPGAKTGEAVSGRASTPLRRATAAGACAVCCGAPLLLLASVVALGVATTVGVVAGLLVAGGAIAWGLLTGRITRAWPRGRRRTDADSCP